MLVLSRKVGQRIVIPECNLGITVVAIEGNRVRLGLSAPPEVAVYREEVWCQIEEKQAEDGLPGHLLEPKKESALR